jgi:hypothetical protein
MDRPPAVLALHLSLTPHSTTRKGSEPICNFLQFLRDNFDISSKFLPLLPDKG